MTVKRPQRPATGAPNTTAKGLKPAPKVSDAPAGGFVPLRSLRPVPQSTDAVLAEIRRIYFETTAKTIDGDLQHAVALLKALPDEDTRERATVYMEGLADMRKEFKR